MRDSARVIRFSLPAADIRRQSFRHLALTELLERFSVHGVKALLTLYLVQHVLAAPTGTVIGLTALAGWIGAATPLALASCLYGVYGALTYAAVPLGGMFADRLVGRRAAVSIGAVLIAAGDIGLTWPAVLLPALGLLAAGTGLVKANLAAGVGALFPRDDPGRRRAFTIYLGFLNGGVLLGPLACGWLAQRYGWSVGFLTAGIAIAIGLLLYRATPAGDREPVSIERGDSDRRSAFGAALAAIVIVTVCFCAYEQVSNIFLIWISRSVTLTIDGFTVPPAWFAAADGLFTIIMVVATTRVPQLARLDLATRLIAGAVAMLLGYASLALAAMVGTTTPAVPLMVLLLLDLGVALVWPAGLAIVTAAASHRHAGLFTGLFYLHGFFANLTVGFLGALYDRMPVPLFWASHAGIAALAAALACGFRGTIRCAVDDRDAS